MLFEQPKQSNKRTESHLRRGQGSMHQKRRGPPLQQQLETSEQEQNTLNQKLKEFQEQHGVSFSCSTLYTHTATTLKDDNSYIVLFQNQVQTDNKLVDYSDYKDVQQMAGDEDDLNSQASLLSVRESELPQNGPFFNLIKAQVGEKQMTSECKRYVDLCYQNAMPIFSSKQELVCLQRQEGNKHFLDVFRCNAPEQAFYRKSSEELDKSARNPIEPAQPKFLAKKEDGLAKLSKQSSELMFSIEVKENCQVVFSSMDHMMGIFTDDHLMIYDLQSADSGSRTSINDENVDEQNEHNFEHGNPAVHQEFHMQNDTYSRIAQVHLGDKDSFESTVQQSWVVLESSKFSSLHLIELEVLLDPNLSSTRQSQVIEEEKGEDDNMLIIPRGTTDQVNYTSPSQIVTEMEPETNAKAPKNQKSDFGMDFFEGGKLIKLDEIEDGQSGTLQVIFQKDGRLLLIKTDVQIVKLGLTVDDENDRNQLVTSRIPITNTEGISLYNFGNKDLVLCRQDAGAASLSLTMLEDENPSDFSETTLQMKSNVQIQEIIQSDQEFENPYLRLIGISDSEQVICWEIHREREQLQAPERKVYNRQDRADFRWPFYAYCLSDDIIVINYLNETDMSIYYKMPFADSQNSYIHKLCFANSCDLYVFCHENNNFKADKKVVIYKIRVGIDCSIELREGMSRTTTQENLEKRKSLLPKQQIVRSLSMMNKGQSEFVANGYVSKIVYEGGRQSIDDAQEFFAIEHKVSVHKKAALLVFDGSNITLIQLHAAKSKRDKLRMAKHKASKILRLSNEMFITLDETHTQIRRLVVRYDSTGFELHELIIYEDFNAKIVNFVGEQGKLYCMVDDRLEIKIKVLNFEETMINPRVQSTEAEDFDLKSDFEFLQAFASAQFIPSGCLIVNEWRLVKVSQPVEGQSAIFQNYFNFLPEETSDQNLLIDQCKIGLKHRRQAILFNFPDSCRPKHVIVQPFFDDNRVSLSQKDGQICWIQEGDGRVAMQSSHQNKSNMDFEALSHEMKFGSQDKQRKIYQFIPGRWKLFQYNMSGLLTGVTSYDSELAKFRVLANSPQHPIFLVTPSGPNYINQLQIVQITGAKKTVLKAQVNLKQVQISKKRSIWRRMFSQSKDLSLFEAIWALEKRYNCKTVFKINSDNTIVIASILPKGYILSMHVLTQRSQTNDGSSSRQKLTGADAYEFVAVEVSLEGQDIDTTDELAKTAASREQEKNRSAQTSAEESFLSGQKLTSMNQSQQALQVAEATADEIGDRAKSFLFMKKFSLSRKKLLLWNKKTILQGDIQQADSQNQIKVKPVLIEIAKLSNCLALQRDDQKLVKLKASVTEDPSLVNSVLKTRDDKRDRLSKESDDYFELVECRDVQIDVGKGKPTNSTMQVKIVTANKSSHIISYNLDKDREVTWVGASQEAQLFYGQGADGLTCFVHDEKFGLINLHSKEQLLEYHALDKNKHCLGFDKVEFGVTWGSRLVQVDDKSIMLFANHLLLPFSYFNIIQRYRSISQDRETKNFFVGDYCVIGQQNNLHKCKMDPAQIEKILDCYWQQNPMYILSVLVNDTGAKSDGVGLDISRTYTKLNSQRSMMKSVHSMEMPEHDGKDVLETQIDLSSYRLINKILLFLSKLPAQLSFYDLMPKFNKLTNFTFFDLYLSTWLQQTSQMEFTQVLYTSMKKGSHQIPRTSSYLDRNFFKDFPVDLRNSDIIADANDMSLTRKFKGANMHQVQISMIQVSWIKDWQTSEKFFRALVDSDNLELFKNRTVIELIEYMWQICQIYLLWGRFVPFMVFLYLPISVFTFIPLNVEHEDWNKVQLGCLIATAIYLMYLLFGQMRDICKLGCNYFTNFSSIWNLIILVFLSAFVYFSGLIVIKQLHDKSDRSQEDLKQTLHLLQIVVLLILNLQLFRTLRIFTFFQSFIRQLLEIIKSTSQIASMLLFVIFVQAELFWVLDENSKVPSYRSGGNELLGFLTALMDSYKLAVGDFEPVQDTFMGNTEYMWLFWLVFFFGTLVSLILLLNMVIAVMSMQLENVVKDQEALVNREKLIECINNYKRLPFMLANKFKTNKQLFVIEVDPQFDLDEHMAKESGSVETQAAERRQNEMMKAQLEQFQTKMLALMAETQKQQDPTFKKTSTLLSSSRQQSNNH